MEKQIIAALELADHEVRLIVGQFYNSRLNILKVERVAHFGISGAAIANEAHVVEAIKKATENASRNLGVVIRNVLLLVPGVQVKRVNNQVRIPVAGRITELDIRRAYRELLETKGPEGYVLTNALVSKYFINGISTRKVPLQERSETMTVEAECYYGKQSLVFSYVGCVEKSGLRVIDIIIDDIAMGKEASLFEASINHPVIAFTLNEQISKMTLFHKGVLMASDFTETGTGMFMKRLETQFNVPHDVVHRLIYDNVDLNNQTPHDDPVFIWSTKTNSHTISQKDIMDVVGEAVESYILDLCSRSEPILQLGDPEIVLVGEGADIAGLSDTIESSTDFKARVYRPTTFGVRDTGLIAGLGAFYYYKDQSVYREKSIWSVEEDELKEVVLQLEPSSDESITKKLKNLFFD